MVVIGAGPMGLEAALGALERGFDVTVLEKDRVGASLLAWGAARFFSPLGMNLSPRARRFLGAEPPDDALLTGPEMVSAVLEPLARTPALRDRVRLGCRVAGVGRARLTRRDMPGHPLRHERPFRLLVETAAGEEMLEADAVLDATGAAIPAAIGTGGVPAPGERAAASLFLRRLGEVEAQLDALEGRDVLLVGHGHSAATAVAWMAQRPRPPRITWATRSLNRRPCVEVAEDPLPERARVVREANHLAEAPPPFLRVERRAVVESITPEGGRLTVALGGGRRGTFDAVVALTGYRPDHSFLSELALEISPSSEGAARLTKAISAVTDCLATPVVSAADLQSGEPRFHFVGAKSYGRLSTFLLRNGRSHLETILDGLAGAP